MNNNYSVSSLKLLEKNPAEYRNKYDFGLYFSTSNEEAHLGSALHKLIYYYIKHFDINKIEKNLDEKIAKIWEKLKVSEFLNKNFIDVEKTFFTKIDVAEKKIYLNGRFDCVIKEYDKIIIIDWKTNKLPENPSTDLQTVVYLYCASKLYKTQKVAIKYVSLVDLKDVTVDFEDEMKYKTRISEVIKRTLK